MDRVQGAIATAASAASLTRPGEASDCELVAAVRNGELRAFELLYDRYQVGIGAFVRGMVRDAGRSEDVTQDVFIAALRRLRETEDAIAFKPWIYEIARNACIDHFRRRRRATELSYDSGEQFTPADELRWLHAGAPTPDVAVARKQELSDLCGAIGELSEVQHRIIVLREFEGLSYKQIADSLQLSPAAVESILFRARRRLGEEYRDLATGERCRIVRAVILDAAAAERSIGIRERRRAARHIARCSPCRQEAYQLGVGDALRPQLAARIAAFLPPLPALLRSGSPGTPSPRASHALAQWSSTLAAGGDQLAASGAKLAAAATIALAGVGAGVATRQVASRDRAPAGGPAHAEANGGGGAAGAAAGAADPRATPSSVVGRTSGGAFALAGWRPSSGLAKGLEGESRLLDEEAAAVYVIERKPGSRKAKLDEGDVYGLAGAQGDQGAQDASTQAQLREAKAKDEDQDQAAATDPTVEPPRGRAQSTEQAAAAPSDPQASAPADQPVADSAAITTASADSTSDNATTTTTTTTAPTP